MIQENFTIETEYKTIKAFGDIEYDQSLLPDEYKKVLNESESIIKKHQQRTINLQYLRILIEDLLQNVSKVRTITNLHDRIADISAVLGDYSYEKLVEIFGELKTIN